MGWVTTCMPLHTSAEQLRRHPGGTPTTKLPLWITIIMGQCKWTPIFLSFSYFYRLFFRTFKKGPMF